MSWLSDFVGGVTGKSQQDAVKNAAKKSNKKSEQYRTEALAALDAGNADLLKLLDNLAVGKASGLKDIEDMLSRVFTEFGRGEGEIGRVYDTAITDAAREDEAGKQAIEQAFMDSIRTGSAAVQKSIAGTGYGNSSIVGNRIATGVVPNAVGGKLQALARLEADRRDRIGALRSEKARAVTGRQNAMSQIVTDTLGRKVDLGQTYFSQEMGLREAPIRNNLNVKAQPGAVYPEMQFPASVSGASAFGSALGPLGFGALGSFANNYFGGLGKKASGDQSVQDLIEALKASRAG